MFELASALFSIADANEFRFARFYIVCEAVPLGTLESPLIVCGLSDTLRESPNVEETRNLMQTSAGRNAHIFLPRMFPFQFQLKSQGVPSYHRTCRRKETACYFALRAVSSATLESTFFLESGYKKSSEHASRTNPIAGKRVVTL